MFRKFNVCDFGAVSGGALCTEHIQKAIDECYKSGGGEVTVPRGRFLTGGVRLRSNVTLHLLEGAVLLGSISPEDYATYINDTVEPISEEERESYVSTVKPGAKVGASVRPYSRWNNAIIRAIGAKNIAIIGEKGSEINGQNCFDPLGEEGYRGPHAINMWFCENITLRGYTVRNSANWAHAIQNSQNIEMSVMNVLPIAASTFVTVSLWVDDPRLTKIISLPVSFAFMAYDLYVGSYVGVINETIAVISILLSFIKERKMNNVFSNDRKTAKELETVAGAPIEDVAKTLYAGREEALKKGEAFAKEISEGFVSDFEKPGDKMAHVSTFMVVGDTVYMTYYANTKEPSEDPKNQTARLVYAPLDDLDSKTFLDLQTTGDRVGDKIIDMVYDTVLMKKDEDTLYVMWTARTEENYYRFYCPFTVSTKTLGTVGVNRFKAGETVNDFSVSGIKSALAENGIPCKKMYSDIGIMQKLSQRTENGKVYYYTGAYSGDFTCIIKSCDLITWEYVSQPDFINDSKWENATYVLGDKVYYFVRQQDTNKCGFLTAYDLLTGSWDRAVEIEDCQSRGDFILYDGGLYLFHAPIDREHIGIVRIDTENIANSEIVLQAKMHTSCFYPFVQYYHGGELAMSYTVERKHIRLARFTLSRYL